LKSNGKTFGAIALADMAFALEQGCIQEVVQAGGVQLV